MSDEPKTVEMPAADPVQILLKEIGHKLDKVGADVGLVANDLGVVKEDVRALQRWKIDTENRQSRTSDRVKQVSQHDLEDAAALADEIIQRKALAEKVDAIAAATEAQTLMLTNIGATLTKVASNPIVKQLGTAILAVITGWLAAKGMK